MILKKLDRQQVIGTLRSTGSTDRDVLYAKKEEMLAETYRLKLLGIAPLIVGGILTASLIGSPVGIPMLFVGFSVRKAYKHNIAVTDDALAEYLRTAAVPRRA